MNLITGVNTHPPVMPSQPLPEDSAGKAQYDGASALSRKKRGVAETAALWPQFSTLRISLMGMTQAQEKFTKDHIDEWAPHINLKLEFTDKDDGDIRIKANNDIVGGFSYVGTEWKKYVGVNEPTMEIGFKDGLDAFSAGTVLHEFGHALGLLHEHQHPKTTLDFHWERIIQQTAHMRSSDFIKDNFAAVVSGVVTSAYDQRSIMHYGFPEYFLRSGEAVTNNNELSEGDKAFARSLYPTLSAKPQSAYYAFLSATRFPLLRT